jgi:peptidoglycan/LPS O-acetylase OafA/YrhL
VLGVIGVHSGLHIAHAGGFGVQVFFVLSGFLITTLLVREFEGTRGIDLPAFYLRRALRLLPALFVFLAFCAVVSLPPSSPYRVQTLGAIPYAVFYSYNWVQALSNPPYGLVTHTWSLAIEEQFYLVWPLLLLLVIRAGGRVRELFFIALGVALASAIWAHVQWMETHSGVRIYYGSDTGATPLMLGSAAGLLRLLVTWTPARLQWLRVLGGIGLAVTALGFLKAWPPEIEYSGASFAMELAVAFGVLGLVSAPIKPLAQVLSFSPLVMLGRVSYGVYLWQGAILMLLDADLHLSPIELLLVGTPLTIAVSLVSYRFVERPFLTLKNSISTRRAPASVLEPVQAPSEI